jgi:hypothetical protein
VSKRLVLENTHCLPQDSHDELKLQGEVIQGRPGSEGKLMLILLRCTSYLSSHHLPTFLSYYL